jgi:hypothetical protein
MEQVQGPEPQSEVRPPAPGTCWRHTSGFLDGTDRLRLCADGLCELVKVGGRAAHPTRNWPLNEVLEMERRGVWVRVLDAPATKGGAQ